MLAYLRAEHGMGPHGIPFAEATDPANQFKYVADPVINFAAKAVGDAADLRHQTYPDEKHHGVMYIPRKVDD